ncbi:MAG: hypothetical protein ABII13_02970 [Patescibacteria group bacterium]|uniref:Uncharacterized protein n=1 Tax=viral metagenome TaxID=1070528 RepID=A0A6M3JNS3_9ZZZZ
MNTKMLRNAASAVYLATEESVAENISTLLLCAADELDSLRSELNECIIQLNAADKGLLNASDPQSGWQGIKKECKLWEERAIKAEKEVKMLKEVRT